MVRQFLSTVGEKILQVLSFIEAKVSSDAVIGEEQFNKAFGNVFADRIIQYFLIFIAPVAIVATIDIIYLHLPLQVYGLLMDIGGALIIARGLFRGRAGIKVDSRGKSITGFGPEAEGHVSAIESEIENTIDGMIGSSLLVTGFLLQIIGAL